MQIYELKGEHHFENNTDRLTGVSVDDELNYVKSASAHEYLIDNSFLGKLTQKISPYVVLEVNGSKGSKKYYTKFIRDPFKSRSKQIDTALAGAMYQYAITSDKASTMAHNQQVNILKKTVSFMIACSFFLVVTAYFICIFHSLEKYGIWLWGMGHLSPSAEIIILFWYVATVMATLVASFISVCKLKMNYASIFSAMFPLLIGLTTLDRGLAVIGASFLVALLIWSLLTIAIKSQLPHAFTYVNRQKEVEN